MHFQNTFYYPFCIFRHVYFQKFFLAVSTVPAGCLCFFTKIFQNIVAQAGGGHTIFFHGLKPACILVFYLFCLRKGHFLEIFVAKKHFTDYHILGGEKKNAFSWFSVTACTASFLIIIFHTLWHIVVDDEAYIGFVDSHTKCVGGNDNLSAVVNEIFLIIFPDRIVHSGMIACDRNTKLQKLFVKGVYIFPGGTVNDSAFIGMSLDIILDKCVLLPASQMLYLIIKILSVEAGYNKLWVF